MRKIKINEEQEELLLFLALNVGTVDTRELSLQVFIVNQIIYVICSRIIFYRLNNLLKRRRGSRRKGRCDGKKRWGCWGIMWSVKSTRRVVWRAGIAGAGWIRLVQAKQPCNRFRERNPAMRDFFEKVIVISLNNAEGERRRTLLSEHLKAIDWPFREPEFFSAVHGDTVGFPDWWKTGGGSWGVTGCTWRSLNNV